ncbi:MAG: tRNA dihydrouridine synthase DusB [Proteobacteria bacterium]|nr:tRNA dihydrouridine synthase DusB [Pseudomonadota bacterium]MBU4297225.1 tRNA dihydrouridine synthase DusB [Pseudomonadota bacterium]MCG2748533.1 tRNA dihydrouridine synthase DusB [Desulfobulbaceae bacterium]
MKIKPLQIAGLTIENPFILAPLAGYTDLPFRLLCREYGAGLVFSEMISCHGLMYEQQKTWDMTQSTPLERPISMQLFGSEPDMMGKAAAMLSQQPIDCIDINMGCPVKKVTKKGAGAALMKSPLVAAKIIREVCANSTKPVTVKFRSGWTHQSINAPEFARMAEEEGASAVTIHARTWSDGFSGTVDWGVIAKSKASIRIPVIGNGDINSYEKGLAMMKQTGCDGVMIGRGCLGRPWVFAQDNPAETPQLRLKALMRHLELIEQFCPPQWALGKIRNHAGKYFKAMRHGAEIRNRIYQAETFAALRQLVDNLLTELLAQKPEEQGEQQADNY